ncbi:Bone morphoproteintic protein 1 [Sparganum proliferum]
MIFTLVLLFVLITTSAANTLVSRANHQAIDTEDITMRSSQQANDMSHVAEGRHRDTMNAPYSEVVNVAQKGYPDAPYLSRSETGGLEGDAAFLKSEAESMRHKNDYVGSNHPQPLTEDDIVYVSNDSGVHSQHETSKDDFIRSENQNRGNSAKSDDPTIRKVNNSLDVNRTTGEEWTRRSRRAVTSERERIWPSGIVPYEIGPQFNGRSRAIFLNAMRVWESLTCVSFVEREPHHQAYIIFTVERCGCCSAVGRQNENSPQTISISRNCESEGTVMHELGHVLGFWHEQSRPDRDAYVRIITENIRPETMHNFDRRNPYEIDSLGETYDYDSIMHYHSAAFAKPNANETIRPTACCPTPEIGQRIKPSVGDVRQMNKLYNCPSCGETFVASAGNFSSPQRNFFSPSAADNGRQGKPTRNAGFFRNQAGQHSLYCRWRILADSGERILLYITHMNMHPPENSWRNDKQMPRNSHACNREYLEVRDGYYSGSRLIGRYCGTDLPPTLVSWSPRMLIEYIRPAGYTGSGFAAKYHIFCGGFMKAVEGWFTSPGYPSNYPPSKICTWWIEVPAGFAIVLTFKSIELEDQTDCPYDYLEIFDGSSDSSPAVRRICGVQLPNPIWSTNNTMEVLFVSDYAVQKKGFVATFRKDIFESVLQRINATTTDARRKKRDELNEKLQFLLCATDKCTISARVVNLSKRSLTPAEISLLSKGLKFNHTDAAPTNFLASLESALLASAIPKDARADIRSCASGLLRQRKRHRNLTVDEEKGLRSLKTDDTIVVVPADKRGATVIMDKVDYVQKANTVFNDREAYAPLAEDPTKKQAAAIKKKVNELARLKLISPNDSKFMTLSDPHIAHAYGLPKVHKPDAPLRIIVPLIGSPTYSLAKWLYRHLKHLADGSQYSIKNSQAFFEKIQGLKVSPDESILSFDVVALFSSIPHNLAIESVARRLRDNPIDIPTHHVLDMLKLCLNNYCQFDGKYYQQVKGTPMGSPISGLLAELVLQRLEQEVAQSFQPKSGSDT